MTFLTDFADQAVVLPIVVAVGVALLAQGWRRGAVAWALVVVVTFATMVVLKDTGHWVLEERPQETTEALVKFL